MNGFQITSPHLSNFSTLIADYLTENIDSFDSFLDFLNSFKDEVTTLLLTELNGYSLFPSIFFTCAGFVIAISVLKTILSLGGSSG